MRQRGSVIIAAMVLVTACSESVPVAPTPSPASPGISAAPLPAPPVPETLVQPPYTVTGRVTDSRGAPVAGAEVWIYGNDSPIENRYGVTFTDSTGRYSVSSPQRVPHQVRALKDSYVTRDVAVQGSPSSLTADITIPHIDRYQLFAPTAVAVGEYARLQAQVDLDNGSTSSGFLYGQLSADNPSVLQIQPTGWISGAAPGAATITARYYGATTTASVRVNAAK
jgi:hypothetical protein